MSPGWHVVLFGLPGFFRFSGSATSEFYAFDRQLDGALTWLVFTSYLALWHWDWHLALEADVRPGTRPGT